MKETRKVAKSLMRRARIDQGSVGHRETKFSCPVEWFLTVLIIGGSWLDRVDICVLRVRPDREENILSDTVCSIDTPLLMMPRSLMSLVLNAHLHQRAT